MKRSLVVVLLTAGTAALVLTAACGTLLGITPDDPGAGDGSAGDGSANDGGTGEGGGDGATDRGLGAELMPATLSLVAGDTVGVILKVAITRPTAEPTPVMVTVEGAGEVIATPLPTNDTRAPTQSFTVTAIMTALARRETINVTVTDGTRTVIRPLSIALEHHYRIAGMTELDLATPQTFTIMAWGGGGGTPSGGAGGFAQGTFTLGAGAYYVVVASGSPGADNGTPGGGMSGGGSLSKGGGGYSGLFAKGAVDSVLEFGLAKLVAGGGGGGAVSGATMPGGAGGSTDVNAAEDGRGSPDSGASPAAGGFPGPSTAISHIAGLPGTMLQGGTGGSDATQAGGGGGGGYFGGGGGGSDGTGGGGGSSFVIGGAMLPKTLGGTQAMPGNSGDPHRGTAGAVGGSGAVIVIPGPP